MAVGAVRSIGILGGTFNPPHLAHLALARHALRQLELDRVLLMPARIPPHKPVGEDPGAEHRLRMCRLSVAEEEGLRACSLEIDRDGPSYTVDTLKAINASQPDARLTFIVGADTARTLGSWREPVRILELAQLAVASRAGSSRQQVLDTVAGLRRTAAAHAEHTDAEGADATLAAGVRFLEMPAVEVSSSMVRGRVARAEPIDALVGAAVAAYIAEHGLYHAVSQVPS